MGVAIARKEREIIFQENQRKKITEVCMHMWCVCVCLCACVCVSLYLTDAYEVPESSIVERSVAVLIGQVHIRVSTQDLNTHTPHTHSSPLLIVHK